MWTNLIVALTLYIIGFLLGRKWEKDKIMDGVYGVVSQVNKNDLMVDSVTYYYTKEAYDKVVEEFKQNGEEFLEEDNDE